MDVGVDQMIDRLRRTSTTVFADHARKRFTCYAIVGLPSRRHPDTLLHDKKYDDRISIQWGKKRFAIYGSKFNEVSYISWALEPDTVPLRGLPR